MSEDVKRRRYHSPRRRAAAEETRHAILTAAYRLFVEGGYAATTMAGIAQEAGVALDTVYAAVGPKPALFRLLVESALSGRDQAVPAEERDYVLAIRAEPSAAGKLAIYAGAVRHIQVRLAPLFRVLQEAAPSHAELLALWTEISRRRANNMRLFAADIAATGALRDDLSLDEAADIVWSMNGPEHYTMLVLERGWEPARFEAWLAEAWSRLLLKG